MISDIQAAVIVDGLKLTLTAEELRKRLTERIDVHERRAKYWQKEAKRTPEEQTEENPVLPPEMCDNEAEQELWRAETLTFVRDHLEPAAVYRLDAGDLEFGEVLPEKPGWMQQQEYEERTNVGFQLERLTKELGRLPFGVGRFDREDSADVLS
jgi:hypothetical protein